ncbi:hypothetical protein NC653_000730 [Populus alba x Populus x berolinensis]|uniref:NTF2 domain-containing protein n=1 Tax=Populus alba x Populus x berolinensis TaxID=444605 RepID=A0AAD6WFN9_9ROSI|nr:hypothetical protein NC653_000730 [Populus alba x Populus x berolinensis]
MDPDQVAKAFVEHYYSTFDANRAGLANLYQDGSMLTFEGQKTQGSQNIVAKLIALPFQQCKHLITTVDCQPSGPAGGMLVFVSGNLQLAGEQHALKFSQYVSCDETSLMNACVVRSSLCCKIDYEDFKKLVIQVVLKKVEDELSCKWDGFSNHLYIGIYQFGPSEFFVHMFHLMPTPQGSFYVFNDIFRLNYA